MKRSKCTRTKTRPALPLYFVLLALTTVAVVLHALTYFRPVDLRLPTLLPQASATLSLVLGVICGLIAMLAWRQDSRRFLISNTLFLGSTALSLASIECVARLSMPSWPASHLHGVDTGIGAEAWGRVQSLHPGATANNSWGQRDAERSSSKTPGTYRVAFVGDSFLEESSFTPLPLLVESSLGDNVEVINLGISAAFPIDYYYLIKNVALRIDADEILTFIYMGNDFHPYPDERSALSRAFLSPAPHSSLMGATLPGVNYWMTRRLKFSTTAWLDNDLHNVEQGNLSRLRELSADDFVEALAEFAPSKYKESCRQELRVTDLGAFRRHLASPDLGLFRTHTFNSLVCTDYRAHGEISPEERARLLGTFGIIREIQALCDAAGVSHRVVLIPQGPEVDRRVQEHWAAIADVERKFEFVRSMASQLRVLLDAYAVETIDLYTVLDRGYGDYLNFDGHWSQQGNERVAAHLAQSLYSSLERAPAVSSGGPESED